MERKYYQAEVSYNGEYESFEFWVEGNSPDLEGDVKSQYKKLRKNRGLGWDKDKYEFISCTPL
jgi:hypothetical protein